MALVELVMPKLGESITEATILKWHKQPGEKIGADETVLEIATDKVDSEIPSTAEGILEEILFQVNDVVPVGAVIAKIRTLVDDAGQQSTGGQRPAYAETGKNSGQGFNGNNGSGHSNGATSFTPAEELPYWNQESATPANKDLPVSGNRFYSPLVLNIAASEGISMNDLGQIPGTGNEGRVTKKDILFYVENNRSGNSRIQQAGSKQQYNAGNAGQQTATANTSGNTQIANSQNANPQIVNSQTANSQIANSQIANSQNTNSQPIVSKASAETGSQSPAVYGGNTEIIEMDRMRKLIAKHMVDSKRISPHVTSFTEADVTNLVLWRDRVKKEFEKREGDKITFTPLFIEAIVKCIKKYPWLNSSVDVDRIIVKKDINIGMATALPNGNLIVPVIKNADQLNLVGLSKQVNSLANSARNGKLRPDDTTGGTFTFTNVGTFGSLMGTPIINQPQVAILAVGAIKKRPVVIETEQGDSIAIRHMMYLSMSYDHRVIDGSLGATFLNAVAKELENFKPDREV